MKILAVDDDSFILELLTMMAARAGFTDVSTALSGEIALDMLKEGDVVFDCLLLDISMPGMDGIELCGLARAMPGYRKTPIIMLTAMAEKDYIDRAFSAGATDYANKPFNIVELHARLHMAEELVAARKEAVSSGTRPGDSRSDGAHGHAFDLPDEVRIEGVKNLIGYTALRNYLTQLSHVGIASSQVIAIKIDQIETIFARASDGEFLYALTEAAVAISDTLRANGYMMAYAGNGMFVVVSGKATLESSAGLETEIQNLLDEKDIEYDNSDPLDIEISIGNPIRPSTSKTQRV
ncbi:MAG: response regulator [Roseovarius sp.]|jgi:CheY-like chemotaxis protein|nr:response regulator [Roseovarius sp.]